MFGLGQSDPSQLSACVRRSRTSSQPVSLKGSRLRTLRVGGQRKGPKLKLPRKDTHPWQDLPGQECRPLFRCSPNREAQGYLGSSCAASRVAQGLVIRSMWPGRAQRLHLKNLHHMGTSSMRSSIRMARAAAGSPGTRSWSMSPCQRLRGSEVENGTTTPLPASRVKWSRERPERSCRRVPSCSRVGRRQAVGLSIIFEFRPVWCFRLAIDPSSILLSRLTSWANDVPNQLSLLEPGGRG